MDEFSLQRGGLDRLVVRCHHIDGTWYCETLIYKSMESAGSLDYPSKCDVYYPEPALHEVSRYNKLTEWDVEFSFGSLDIGCRVVASFRSNLYCLGVQKPDFLYTV